MNEPDVLGRITGRPDVFGGKPTIHDMRIFVESVLGLLAQGESAKEPAYRTPGARTR